MPHLKKERMNLHWCETDPGGGIKSFSNLIRILHYSALITEINNIGFGFQTFWFGFPNVWFGFDFGSWFLLTTLVDKYKVKRESKLESINIDRQIDENSIFW